MSGTYSLLITLIPTLLFVLIVLIAIILGIIRGFRKSLILAIQALAAFIICIILFAILANNSQVDTNLVNIVNNFMGQGGLQRQMGVSESSTSVTEILYEFIPKQMDYGDGLALILRENGQYLLQLVLFVYRLILAIICLFIYFLLVFIFYIIYLIFYPERRYKKKIEEGYASLNSEKTYKKRCLYGSLIGLLRGLVGGIVIMAFIGSFFYIAGGVGNKKYNDQLEVNNSSLKEGYQIYEALGSYGTSGIFKVLNTIKVKDNMPFYLYAADLVFSGRINDPERGINVKFNFADEMGAYTTFTRETIDLLMKYGKEDLIKAINANDNIMNTVLKIMDMPEFQEEFNILIDNFNAKTYFINFSLSLLDSIIAHIDQLKIAETSPDMVETISLMFKKGYLSKYIPEEQEILDQLKTNPNYEYETRPFITASNLLTKEDAKSLLKFVVAAIELDETKDDAYKIMTFSENLLPSLGELTILNGKRESEFNDVYERLYFYLDNRYIQTALQQDSESVEYDRSDVILRGIETEKLDWTTEIKELLNSSANVLGIARSVYDPNKEVFNNVISMFDSTNPDAQSNEQKYDAIVDSLKKSELLNKVMSSNGMSAYIRNMLQSSIPTIYVPKVNYMNIKNPDGTETNGEAYNLLVGFKSILKNTNTRALLNDFKKLSSGDTESTNYVRSLLYAMNTTEGGVKPIDTALESSLLRAVFTGAITSNATGSLEIILPDSILEEENGVKVNVIQKEELVNTIDNLLTIMPESGEINQVTLIKEILANKESLVSSAIISASAINMMVNDPKNSLQGVLVIPDEYKAAATKEELREYSSTNIWSSSDELLHLLDGLDKGFGLQESEFDLNDQDAATELIKANIKKLNDKVSEGSNETKLDVCYNSIIIKASITNHMQGDDVKGLIIPDDAFDDNDAIKVDNVDKKNIYKSEISLLVDISNRLDIDLSKADIENIYLRNKDIPTLVSSKIFRATIDSELKNNNEIIVPLDEIETMHNGYISEGELTNLLNILTKYRENILGEDDDNKKINIKQIQVDNEKIKEFKVSELKELTDSNILQATVINKLATSTDYPISVPNKLEAEADKTYLETDDNFIKSNWYSLNELNKILTSFDDIFEEGTTIGQINEDLIKTKVLQDGAVEACYNSIVLNYTISEKLSEQLDKPDMNRTDVTGYTKESLANSYNLSSDFTEITYKKEEVIKLVTAVKAIGVTDISNIESEVNADSILDLEDNVIDTLHESIIVWDILTVKVKTEINKPDSKMVDHPLAEEKFNSDLSLDFYKENEIISIKSIVQSVRSKEGNQDKTLEEIFNNFDPADIDINSNKNTILASYILMANVTHNISTNDNLSDPIDAYDDTYVKGSEYELLTKTAISDLIDAAIKLNIKLGESIDSIKLDKANNSTISKSIILRATIYDKLKTNNKVPYIALANNEENNTYLTYDESMNLLDSLCDNKVELFDLQNENDPVNLSNEIFEENVKKIKLINLDDMIKSYILHATIIDKISTGSFGIDLPNTYATEVSSNLIVTDFTDTNWVKNEEMKHIIAALKSLFGNTGTLNIDEDSIKGKILSDDFDIDVCYQSIVIDYTISEKLDEQLSKPDMAREETRNYTKSVLSETFINISSSFSESAYNKEDVSDLLAAIKALGINDFSNIETGINADSILGLKDEKVDTLYQSILVWDILSTTMESKISANADIKDHELAKINLITTSNLEFYQEIEIISIKSIINDVKSKPENADKSLDDILSNLGASDISVNETTKKAIKESYILMATITDKVYSDNNINDPIDAYDNTYDRSNDNRLLDKVEIIRLLDVVEVLGLDLGNLNVEYIKLDKNNNQTLARSIIFRGIIYDKLKDKSDIKLTNTSYKDEENNTYLTYDESMNLFDALCDNKTIFYGDAEESEIANPDLSDENIKNIKISSLESMIKSDILHATIIYKLAIGSFGIEIPSTYQTEATTSMLTDDFYNTNWYLLHEMTNLINSIELLCSTPENQDPSIDVDPSVAKSKLLEDDFDISTCYKSIIVNLTVSKQIESAITSNRDEVVSYSTEALKDSYGLTTGFEEITYKELEVIKMIAAIKTFGITDLDSISGVDYGKQIISIDDDGYDTIYDSAVVTDILYTEFKKIVDDPANNIKDHAKARTKLFGIDTIEFYKESEIIAIKDLLKDNNIEDINNFDPNTLIISIGIAADINESYILRNTVTNVLLSTTIVIDRDSYDTTDELITETALSELFNAIVAGLKKDDETSFKVSEINADSISPKSIKDRDQIFASSIMIATISNNISTTTGRLYIDKNLSDKTTNYNDLEELLMINTTELEALLDAIENQDNFNIEIDIDSITITNLEKCLKSNILSHFLTGLVKTAYNSTPVIPNDPNGYRIAETLSEFYNQVITLTGTLGNYRFPSISSTDVYVVNEKDSSNNVITTTDDLAEPVNMVGYILYVRSLMIP